jgi:exosortase E/protease (VPEID-CTERM system)
LSAEPDCIPVRATHALPVLRWALLLALLAAEVVLGETAVRDAVHEKTGLRMALLRLSPLLLRLVIAVGAATLLACGQRLWEEIRAAAALPDRPSRWWPFLLGHLALVGAFAGTTSWVGAGGVGSASYPYAQVVVGWLLAGGALVLWARAALPGPLWLRLASRCRAGLLAGAVVGLAAWGAGLLMARFWEPASRATLWVVHGLLSHVYPDTFCRPEALVVGTPAFAVHVAPQCSGYEGIGLLWIFLGAYLWLFRHRLRFPHALVLLPLGTAIIWLANAVRIAGLVALGTAGWSAVAEGGFHSQAGWLAFNAVALGLVFLSGRVRWVRADGPAADSPVAADVPAAAAGPAAAYLAPLLASVAAAMVVAAFAADFEWLYPLRVAAVLGVLWAFRHSYARLGWGWSWQAVALGGLTFLIWAVLAPGNPGAEFRRGADWSSLPAAWAAAWVVVRLLGFVVAVPLAEELAFRGYLTRRLQAAAFAEVPLGRFSWLSFVGSSVLFGALHGQAWLPGILAGMLFAVALYRRGRLGDAVIAHATANGLIALCGITGFVFFR